MPLEGMDEIQANLKRLGEQMIERAGKAADEIASLLESYSKSHAPFKDQSGNLRQSIRGTWEHVRRDVFRVILSASMEYAAFVELLHQGRYAYLWPAVLENEKRIQQIWHDRLAL